MHRFHNTCRATLMRLGFLGFAVLYSLRVNLSIAIVAMVKHYNQPLAINQSPNYRTCTYYPYGSHHSDLNLNNRNVTSGEFNWDESTQGQILGSFFYGYVLTNLLGGRLADNFGGRIVFGSGVVLTALLAIISPSAAWISKDCFVLVRLLQGMTEGVTFPAINSLMASWVPPSERSYFVARIYSGVQFGTFFTMMFSGFLADTKFGWPSIFITTGVVGILWGFLWFNCISDTPTLHPRITEEEKLYLLSTVGKGNSNMNAEVPWTRIATSIPFIAVVIAHFGSNWGFYCLLTELPSYLSSVHHLRIEDIGFYVAMSYLLMMFVMIGFSSAIDYWISSNQLGIRNARKLGTAVGLFGPMFILLLLTSVGCNFFMVIFLIWMAVALSGAHVSGYSCGFQELAPNYAGTITGISNTIASIPGFLAPQVAGAIINDNNTMEQWNKVFLLAAAIYLISGSFYVLFMSEKVQPWNSDLPLSTQRRTSYTREVKHV